MQNKQCSFAFYPYPPFGCLSNLARRLNSTVADMDQLIAKVPSSYLKNPIPKKGGGVRDPFSVVAPLKSIQDRIKCLILKQAEYPYYLMGGLPKRDHVRNAQIHAGARVMLNEDVAAFYPSISATMVFDIWRNFFHFPSDVSRVLTGLTTFQGQLPQGAKTSSYLANLIFCQTEPRLVQKLSSMDFIYTRFVDDITISSTSDKSPQQIGSAIGAVASMLTRFGMKFKRKKHKIVRAGQRMEVTGLVVGKKKVGLLKKRRSDIRALVHHCKTEGLDPNSPDSKTLRKASSLVGQYSRFHPGQGQVLKSGLTQLKEERAD